MKLKLMNASVVVAVLTTLGGLIFVPAAVAAVAGQDKAEPDPVSDSAQAEATRIQQIRTAAPASIVQQATIISPKGEVLQKGAGEWVCRIAGQNGKTPACLDSQFRAYLKARLQGKKPHVERLGVAYMFHGMTTGSGMFIPPHIMLVVPDPTHLKGHPTEPQTGTPWVMKADTPYAHLMLPVGGG
jgi:hypothetical protein